MRKLSLGLVFIGALTLAPSAGAFFEIEGLLRDNNGDPLPGSYSLWVDVRLAGDPTCVLYREKHSSVTVDSSGSFVLTVGAGTRVSGFLAAVEDVVKNEVAQQCYDEHGNYIKTTVPDAKTVRALQVEFEDSYGAKFEIGSMLLSVIPYALQADSVGPHSVRSLMRVEDGGQPRDIPPFTLSEADELRKLARGESALYMQSGSGAVATLPSYSSSGFVPPAGSIWFESGDIKFSNGAEVISLAYGAGSGAGVTSLPEGHILVGDSSGQATAVEVSGDIVLDGVGKSTVKGLQDTPVSALTPQDGQVLKFDADSNSWVPSRVSVSDLKTLGGVSQFAGGDCSAGQTLSWNALTDQFVCVNIAISMNQIKDLAFSGDLITSVGSMSAKVTGLQGRSVAETEPMAGQVLKWDGAQWAPAPDLDGGGSITAIHTGSGLVGGPITTSGTIAIAAGGVHNSHLADGAVSAAKIGDGEVIDVKIAEVSDTKLKGTIKVISGQVGIGTLSPAARLDVAGALKIGDAGEVCSPAGAGMIRYSANSFQLCDGVSWQVLSSGGVLSLNGLTGPSQNFSIAHNGTSPSISSSGSTHTFNIPKAAAAGAQLGLISNADYIEFKSKLSSSLPSGKIWVGNSSDVATAVAPSGDVSMSNTGMFTIVNGAITANKIVDGAITTPKIGTAQVTNDKIASVDASKITSGILELARLPGAVVLNGGNTGALTIGTNNSSNLFFETNDAVRMTVTGGGNVGIGTTSPSAKLQVMGDIVTDAKLKSNVVESMTVNATNVYASNAVYAVEFNYSSDRRLKTDIRPVERPLEKVLNLEGVNFKWKTSGKEDLGFIAQDVERVLPEVVGERTDPELGEVKTVRYGNLTALLIEAVKEIWRAFKASEEKRDEEILLLKERLIAKDAENQALERRLLDLEERLKALEQKTCGPID